MVRYGYNCGVCAQIFFTDILYKVQGWCSARRQAKSKNNFTWLVMLDVKLDLANLTR